MLRVRDHGSVSEIEMSSWGSRLTGYKVSAFLHRGILIDSGFPRAQAELASWLAANQPSGGIVTHWHEDHAGNLALLSRLGIPVTVGPGTLERVRRPRPVPLYRKLVWGDPEPLAADLVPAAHPFELVPTPGHTDDHVAVWDPDSRFAFTGDLFLGVRAAVVHPTEDPIILVESLRRVLALDPVLVFDAHRGIVQEPKRAFAAKIDWLETAIEGIRRLGAEGVSDREIVRRVLGPEDSTRRLSGGEMSKLNFVRAVVGRAQRDQSA